MPGWSWLLWLHPEFSALKAFYKFFLLSLVPCSSCLACSVVLGGSFGLPSLPLGASRKISASSVPRDAHVPPLSHMEQLNNVSLPQKSCSLVLKRSIYPFLFLPEMGERGTCIYFSFPVLKSWVSSSHNTLSLPHSLISMIFWFFNPMETSRLMSLFSQDLCCSLKSTEP